MQRIFKAPQAICTQLLEASQGSLLPRDFLEHGPNPADSDPWFWTPEHANRYHRFSYWLAIRHRCCCQHQSLYPPLPSRLLWCRCAPLCWCAYVLGLSRNGPRVQPRSLPLINGQVHKILIQQVTPAGLRHHFRSLPSASISDEDQNLVDQLEATWMCSPNRETSQVFRPPGRFGNRSRPVSRPIGPAGLPMKVHWIATPTADLKEPGHPTGSPSQVLRGDGL